MLGILNEEIAILQQSLDDQLSQIIPVVNNHWQTMVDLPNKKR